MGVKLQLRRAKKAIITNLKSNGLVCKNASIGSTLTCGNSEAKITAYESNDGKAAMFSMQFRAHGSLVARRNGLTQTELEAQAVSLFKQYANA